MKRFRFNTTKEYKEIPESQILEDSEKWKELRKKAVKNYLVTNKDELYYIIYMVDLEDKYTEILIAKDNKDNNMYHQTFCDKGEAKNFLNEIGVSEKLIQFQKIH